MRLRARTVDVNLYILGVLEDTFSLDVAHFICSLFHRFCGQAFPVIVLKIHGLSE